VETKKNFHKRTDCIAAYWGNKPWEIQGVNIPINGNLTLDENIADLGGVLLSYEAYGMSKLHKYFKIIQINNSAKVLNFDLKLIAVFL